MITYEKKHEVSVSEIKKGSICEIRNSCNYKLKLKRIIDQSDSENWAMRIADSIGVS